MIRFAWTGDPPIFLVRHPARDMSLPSFSPPPNSSLAPCTAEQLAGYLGAITADLHFVQASDTKEFSLYNAGLRYAADLAYGPEHVDRYFHTDLAILPDGQYLQLILLPQYGPDAISPHRIKR